MIDSVRGKVLAASPGHVLLEIGGVGLRVDMPVSSLPEKMAGREITVYTRLIIKEDEIMLYGFAEPLERNLFNLVISVTGFGPRLALALLGTLPANQFYLAVLEENIALLCRAPGVGRKVAQRLVLEIKEKLPPVVQGEVSETVRAHLGSDSGQGEILDALSALGYSRAEAASAVSRALEHSAEGASQEDLLRMALKNIGNR